MSARQRVNRKKHQRKRRGTLSARNRRPIRGPPQIILGTLLTFAVFVLYVVEIWTMTWDWRRWLKKSLDADAPGRGVSARVAPRDGRARGGRGATADAASVGQNYGDMNKRVVDRFIASHARIGAKDIMEGYCLAALMLTLALALFWDGVWDKPPVIIACLAIMVGVYVSYVMTLDSPIGQAIFFEALEIVSHVYIILQWGGDDPLLQLGMDEGERAGRVRGAAGAWSRERAGAGSRTSRPSSR